MTKFLDAALEYADRGWKVFPLRPNTKKPIHDGGFHNGTSDATQIELWWSEHPNANIGLNLVASGLVAVDVDSYKKECEWEGFKGDRPFEPECIHRSARGGWHYIFKAKEGQTFSDPCSGVEIKHKGYIVLAPSTFEGKPYTWVQDDEPTPAPDWLPGAKESKPFEFGVSKDKQSDKDLIDLIKTGQWIENIMKLVARYVQRGLHDDQIHAVTDLLTLKGYTVDDTRKDVQKLIDGARRKGWDVRPDSEDEPTDALQGLSISNGVELSERDFPMQVWLKDNLLPIPNFALIAGPPKAGKSWYVLGLADELTSKGHQVIYIANEDNERRLKQRYAKICDFPSPNLIFISGLSSEKPLPRGAAALRFISALKKQYPDLKCVIIDTLQAIREPSRKENYANVETEFAAIRKLAHELNITVIGVHHTKKANGEFESTPIDKILGSQGIAATVETIVVLEQARGSQDVNLFITGKDVEQQEEHRLHWTEQGFSEPQNKALAERGPFQRKIIDYVKEHPRCTQVAIADELGRTKQQVNAAVDTLLECRILQMIDGRLVCSA